MGIPGRPRRRAVPLKTNLGRGIGIKVRRAQPGVWSYDFCLLCTILSRIFAGFARGMVKKAAEGIPPGGRRDKKAAPRKTVRNRLPEIPGRAAKNGRSGRSVPLRPLRYYSSPTVRRPTERPSLPHRRVLRATAGKRLHGCRELYRDNRRASVWRKRATEGSRKQPGITGAQARSTGSERG